MAIGKLLHWLYCLDFVDAVVLLIACSVLFCLAHNRFAQYCSWKVLVTLLLFIATVGVVHTTLGTRTSGETLQVNLIPFHSYREVMNGGNPEILRSNFMNAVLFYPIGLLATALLPEKWSERLRRVLTITLCTMLSVGIEYLQYTFSLGQSVRYYCNMLCDCAVKLFAKYPDDAIKGSLVKMVETPDAQKLFSLYETKSTLEEDIRESVLRQDANMLIAVFRKAHRRKLRKEKLEPIQRFIKRTIGFIKRRIN